MPGNIAKEQKAGALLITADTFLNAQSERLAALLHPIVRFRGRPFLTGLPRLQSQYIRDTDAPIDVIWSSDFQRSSFRTSDQP
jgi:hypothetical protein